MQTLMSSLQCSAGFAVVPRGRVETGVVSSALAFVSSSPGLRLRHAGGLKLGGHESLAVGAHGRHIKLRQQRLVGRIVAEASATNVKWILEAAGDGTSKHLDEVVAHASSFEITKDSTTVGRTGDKVDVVLDIATVSGVHAKLEKKDNVLYVTDLESTNGTFVTGKKIKPGTASPVPPGSVVTFGDVHLAVFKFTTVEETVAAAEETVPVAVEETVKVTAEEINA